MSIDINALSFSYGVHNVLTEISFHAEYGEFLSILGPNGAGKSTLMRCMASLLQPSHGSVSIDGKYIAEMTAAELAKLIAYIPQSHVPSFDYSVFEMALMGTTAQLSAFSFPGKAQKKRALNALERLGIDHLRNHSYRQISGGEQQLVLIARALAQQAKILIMDEPSSSLDFGNRFRLMQTIRQLADNGYAVIQSTHDPEQAYLYSDKILALHGGRALAHGTPQDMICSELISKLYGIPISVHSLHEDRARVCIPPNAAKQKG